MEASTVRWIVLRCDGTLRKGFGPEQGLVAELATARACAFLTDGMPPLVVAGGPALLWTVEHEVVSGRQRRWWGLTPPEGQRVWLWPDATMVGVGAEIEDVTGAWELLRGAV